MSPEDNAYDHKPQDDEAATGKASADDAAAGSTSAGDAENGERPERGEGKEMSFLDHLEELRWRIIYSLIGIVAGAALIWGFKDPIMDYILLKPAVDRGLHLQNLRPFGQVILYMQVAIFGGIVISIPNLFYQVWKFISPGLYPHERKYVTWIVIFTTLCFLAGLSFAYFVILPASFRFFVNFGTEAIENIISIEYYFDFVLTLLLAAGFIFELPMLSFFLSKLGILTPRIMRKFWRHAMVTSFIAAAILSPGQDPFTMILLAIPLVLLYEVSILISRVSSKKDGPRSKE